MTDAGELLELGLIAHRRGDLTSARSHYRELLAADPQHADAWHLLGVVADQCGDAAEAEELIQRAIRLNPHSDVYLHNLGEVCRRAGDTDRAISYFQRSLALAPDSVETLSCLGEALRNKRQWDAALAYSHRATELAPGNAVALVNLGHVLRDLGRGTEAFALYRTAIEREPDSVDAWLAYGLAHFDEHPTADSPLDENRFDEAARCFLEALRRQPNHVGALTNLAAFWHRLGDLKSADEYYRAALAVKPTDRVAQGNRLMLLNYLPQSTAESLLAEHQAWAHSQVSVRSVRATSHDRDSQRPLRVGYVSADFRSHPVAQFIEPVLLNHDPLRVQSFLYANFAGGDNLTDRLRAGCGCWRTIVDDTNEAVARQIQADAIDILVDLAGHTANNRLGIFALKPAPLQVTYLGYPCTTGLPTFDYLITDGVVDPPEVPAFMVEEPLRIAGSFCCYQPATDAPHVTRLPAAERGYVTFGSLHHLAKLNDEVLDTWAEILRRLPTARLLVSRHTLIGSTRARLAERFSARGIDPPRVDLRADFTPENQHLHVYGGIDISLDVFPWSGHTSACESLWMGVPVVTLRGRRHAGRMVASVLTAVGRPEWIAEDLAGYVARAEMLAKDLQELANIRAGLRQQLVASPLCDGPTFTRNLEDAYRQIWARWCAAGAENLG